MEHEKLEYKVVMDDGLDSEVLGRLRDLEFAGAVYMAAVAKYPKRNVYLRRGANIIRQNLGEPKPEPPPGSHSPGLERQPDPGIQDARGLTLDGANAEFAATKECSKPGVLPLQVLVTAVNSS